MNKGRPKSIKDTIKFSEEKKQDLINTLQNGTLTSNQRDKLVLFRINRETDELIKKYLKNKNISFTSFMNFLIKDFFESNKEYKKGD